MGIHYIQNPGNSNPIIDINDNGVLDGEDLLKLLNTETQKRTRRGPSDRVHGVLAMADIDMIARSWNKTIYGLVATGEPVDLKAVQDTFAYFCTERLEGSLPAFRELLQQNPNFVKDRQAEIDSYKNRTPAERETLKANLRSFADFADRFEKDFPNGIDIGPEHVLPILSRFTDLRAPRELLPAETR